MPDCVLYKVEKDFFKQGICINLSILNIHRYLDSSGMEGMDCLEDGLFYILPLG